jgi:hypothetical protein
LLEKEGRVISTTSSRKSHSATAGSKEFENKLNCIRKNPKLFAQPQSKYYLREFFNYIETHPDEFELQAGDKNYDDVVMVRREQQQLTKVYNSEIAARENTDSVNRSCFEYEVTLGGAVLLQSLQQQRSTPNETHTSASRCIPHRCRFRFSIEIL